MTHNQRQDHPSARFTDDAYMSAMMLRLRRLPDGEFREDGEVLELLAYVTERFAKYAQDRGQAAGDVALPAWEVILAARAKANLAEGDEGRVRSVWGAVTTAVTTYLNGALFAGEALVSVARGKKGGLSGKGAVRFADREHTIWEHHPALAAHDRYPDEDEDARETLIATRTSELAELFADARWPRQATETAIAVVVRLYEERRSRTRVYEQLRKSARWPALCGLPSESWTTLLRLLLGSPADPHAKTDAGKGLLLRLRLGETVADWTADGAFLLDLARKSPRRVQHYPTWRPYTKTQLQNMEKNVTSTNGRRQSV